tara:strand:+ start:197 stop:817 length:621 start_codon:yes stop_codon:yes gene_type:complete
MENYIYIKNKAINEELCDELINFFEIYKNKRRDGVVLSGMNKEIKDTTDITLNLNDENYFISRAYKTIHNIIFENVDQWNEQLKKQNQHENIYIRFIDSPLFLKRGLLMQKYNKKTGFYTYHNDFSISSKIGNRVITFIFYLNDVEKGGETEFFGKHKISPERGKIVLFPASWTFPHRGISPISDDKYILTGWIYTDFMDEDKKLN